MFRHCLRGRGPWPIALTLLLSLATAAGAGQQEVDPEPRADLPLLFEADAIRIEEQEAHGATRPMIYFSRIRTEMAANGERIHRVERFRDRTEILEIDGRQVVQTTVRGGARERRTYDLEALRASLRRLGLADDDAGPGRVLAVLGMLSDAAVSEDRVERTEVVDGHPTRVSVLRLRSGGIAREIRLWMPEESQLLGALGPLQSYEYRIVMTEAGERAILIRGFRLQNIRVNGQPVSP